MAYSHLESPENWTSELYPATKSGTRLPDRLASRYVQPHGVVEVGRRGWDWTSVRCWPENHGSRDAEKARCHGAFHRVPVPGESRMWQLWPGRGRNNAAKREQRRRRRQRQRRREQSENDRRPVASQSVERLRLTGGMEEPGADDWEEMRRAPAQHRPPRPGPFRHPVVHLQQVVRQPGLFPEPPGFEAAARAAGFPPVALPCPGEPCWLRVLIGLFMQERGHIDAAQLWGLLDQPRIRAGHYVVRHLELADMARLLDRSGLHAMLVVLHPQRPRQGVGARVEVHRPLLVYHRPSADGNTPVVVLTADFARGQGHFWLSAHALPNGGAPRPCTDQYTAAADMRVRDCQNLADQWRENLPERPELPAAVGAPRGICCVCQEQAPVCRMCQLAEGDRHAQHRDCAEQTTWPTLSGRAPPRCIACHPERDRAYDVVPLWDPNLDEHLPFPDGQQEQMAVLEAQEAVSGHPPALAGTATMEPVGSAQPQLQNSTVDSSYVLADPRRLPGEPEIYGPALPVDWRRVYIITGTYLPEFPQAHQCLYHGGRACREINRRHPGPHCVCGLRDWQRGRPCRHIVWALLRGCVVLIHGWQHEWARKMFWYSGRVWMLQPRGGLPVVRDGRLYQVSRPQPEQVPPPPEREVGYEPEALMPYPAPHLYEVAGHHYPLERVDFTDGFVAVRPSVTWGSVFWQMCNAVRTPTQWVRAALGLLAGVCINAIGELWQAVEPLLAELFDFVGTLGGYHWHTSVFGLSIGKAALAVSAALHLPVVAAGALVILALVVIKGSLVHLVQRWLPEGMFARILYAMTGILQFGSVFWCWLESSPAFTPIQGRPPVEDVIDFGPGGVQRAMTTEVTNRAILRGIAATDLMGPLVANVAAQANWPAVTGPLGARNQVEVATLATAGVFGTPAVGGSGLGNHCRACGIALARHRPNFHLCDECLRAARVRPGDNPLRYRTIEEERLPVSEAAPLLAIKARRVPPPETEQRPEWRTVKTNYLERIHAAEIRRQNEIRRAVLPGVGHPGHFPNVFQRGAESMYQGLRCRTYRKVPQRDDEIVPSLIAVRDAIFRHVPKGEVRPMPREEWFAEQERELEMRAAARALEQEGFTDEDKVCKPFIKSEFNKKGQKPRPIYTLSDKTQVCVGVWTLPLLKFMAKHCGRGRLIQYCGCNKPSDNAQVLLEIEAALMAGGTVWLNDFTCWETTQDKRTMGVVRGLYRQVWCDWDEDREMCMDWWEAPKFKARCGGFKFAGRLPEMMCSGRADTALTNSLLNAIATATAHVAARMGLHVREVAQLSADAILRVLADMRMYFVGDDSVVTGICPGPDYTAAVSRAYQQMAFDCKLEEKHHVRDVVFLGNRPYNLRNPDGSRQWQWGPTLGRRLYKHHWMLDPIGNPYAWLQQVVDMEVQCYSHVPILGTLARRSQQLYGDRVTCKKVMLSRLKEAFKWQMQVETQVARPDRETFEDLAIVYGVSAEALISLDRKCAQIPTLPYLLSDPVLDVIMEADN